jgi:hypothetical protein
MSNIVFLHVTVIASHNFETTKIITITYNDVVLVDWPWPQGTQRPNFQGLGLGLGPLGLGLEDPGLGLVAWPWLKVFLNVINTQSLKRELNSSYKTTSPITVLLKQH